MTATDAPLSVNHPWGIIDAVVALLAGYLGAALVAGAVGLGTTSTLGKLFVANIPLYAVMAGVPIWATARRGAGPVADLGLRFSPLDLLALPVGALLQFVVGWAYLPFVDHRDLERPARELADRTHGSGGWALLVLMTCVLAPFAEELFYRGLVMRSLLRRFAGWAAIVITAAWFAAMHFEMLQFWGLFAFGLVAGFLANRTGRLGTSVALHAGFNAVAVLALR